LDRIATAIRQVHADAMSRDGCLAATSASD
jgi:hypothetical protein